MKRHFVARNPLANVNGLDEVVSTDPIFANCKSVDPDSTGGSKGWTGAQIYYGVKSKHIDAFGITSKGDFPKTYQDFLRIQGAPSILRRDRAWEEDSEDVTEIQRSIISKDQFSEPYHQHQNPVEGGANKWLKKAVHTLLDRVGAPDPLWYLALLYLVYVWNHTWHSELNMTPHRFRHGVTPDISSMLQFNFYKPVLYYDHEESWPSSKERSGGWAGIAENIGDCLTYWILDDQSLQV